MPTKLYKSKVWLKMKRDAGLSVEQIAKEANCSVGTINNYMLKYQLINKGRTWSK